MLYRIFSFSEDKKRNWYWILYIREVPRIPNYDKKESMSHFQTYNFISRFKQTKIFQKQCLVLCSLKNLKLFPDIDSFMGVVFHGWIVSTITETNYIFRMLQLVSFLHSMCNILFQRIYYIAQANYWVCSRYCVK